MRINPEEKDKIYRQALSLLGAPIRPIQLEDTQLDDFLTMAVEDYVAEIQEWLIESQWSSLIGIPGSDAEFVTSFIKGNPENFDYITKFTYPYSKIVGLQAGEGGYELKKDYIELRKGVQLYQIPAGREVNELMWYTPPTLDQSVIDPFLGVWNNQFGAEYIGLGSYYIMPAFDILMRASDRNLKNRMIRSELTYRITNGPNGTKYLHLYNTPGGKFDFRNSLSNQGKVWYWYYDIGANGDADKCREVNKDIIRTPADVKLSDLSFDELNNPSKIWIRKYFVAMTKEALGRVRGTFGGKLPSLDADIEMDYQSLLTEGKDEKEVLKREIREKLMKFNPLEMLKRFAQEAEEINKALKYRAMPKPIRII
jgi:hypothetical protein